MNYTDFPIKLPKPEQDGACDHLLNLALPEISLPTQAGNLLKLCRSDTFRLVIFCYPMTGRSDRPLPENWNSIPGAAGCTPQNSSFRDNYDEFIKLNSIPVGISSQSIEDIKEMTLRLKIPYDVLSDKYLKFTNAMNLPTFTINHDIFIKRLTIVVEKNIIKKFFYPIFPPDKHIIHLINWLKNN